MRFAGIGKSHFAAAVLGIGIATSTLLGGTPAGAAPAGGANAVRSAGISCWCDTFFTTANLNLRSGKGTSYSVITVIPEDTEIIVSVDPNDAGNGFFKAY